MGWLNPKPPKSDTARYGDASSTPPPDARTSGWRSGKGKTTGSTARVTVGDGQTVSVTNAGGSRGASGWRSGRGKNNASTTVTTGDNSRVTTHTSNGDIKNIRN